MFKLDMKELDLSSTGEEFTIMTHYMDIHDDYKSLEEARIILGHSPCYQRRGYSQSFHHPKSKTSSGNNLIKHRLPTGT